MHKLIAHDPSLNMVQLLHSGRSARENLLQGGWQPTPAMMLSSTHRAKLYSGDTSHRLPGRFSFSCLIAVKNIEVCPACGFSGSTYLGMRSWLAVMN